MWARRLRTTVKATCRAVPALVLATMLLPGVFSQAAPARADQPIVRDHRDPDARLQLVIKKLIIHDDSDVGEGEMLFTAEFWACPEGSTDVDHCSPRATLVRSGSVQILAESGAAPTVNWVLPSATDALADESISATLGIPVHAGRSYGWKIKATEEDAFFDDAMGDLYGYLSEETGWGVGTATRRGWRNTHDYGGFCVRIGSEGCSRAHFSVEYEVRLAPLPDLRPSRITILDAPGSTDKLVCMAVQNIGPVDAGPFEAVLRLDRDLDPLGRAEAGRLGSGEYGELCVQVALPQEGVHRLSVAVDDRRVVYEQSETNNVYVEGYAPRLAGAADGQAGGLPVLAPSAGADPGPAAPAPTGPGAPGSADLTMKGIRVRGGAPGGAGDCDPGRNDVTVDIRNGGTAAASGFAVRLIVDGEDDEAKEQAVAGLGAGEETEVTFDDVRLRRGMRTLAATVDASNAIAESDEANNELTLTVNCRE